MKKEWFEPGPDGVSPFEKAYTEVTKDGYVYQIISAAFRALLAEEQQPAPVELRVGDVVRLERYECGEGGLVFIPAEGSLVGSEFAITYVYLSGNVKVAGTAWPASACTLIRRAVEVEQHDERDALINQLRGEVELAKEDRDNQYRVADRLRIMNNDLEATCAHLLSERDAARAEVERLTAQSEGLVHDRQMAEDQYERLTEQRDAARAEVERLTALLQERTCERDEYKAQAMENGFQRNKAAAERDALQARIDGGKVMYGGMYGHEHDIEMWTFTHVDTDTMTALLIDAQPLDHIVEPNKMVDERKGKEQRFFNIESGAKLYMDAYNKMRDDRRVTPGTRADRRAHEQASK